MFLRDGSCNYKEKLFLTRLEILIFLNLKLLDGVGPGSEVKSVCSLKAIFCVIWKYE